MFGGSRIIGSYGASGGFYWTPRQGVNIFIGKTTRDIFMDRVDVYPTIAWSAGPGCHGGCGQKLFVEDGKTHPRRGRRKQSVEPRSFVPARARAQAVHVPPRPHHPAAQAGGRARRRQVRADRLGRGIRHLRAPAARRSASSTVPSRWSSYRAPAATSAGRSRFLAYSFGSPNWVPARSVRAVLLHAAARRDEDRDGRLRASPTARSFSRSATTIRNGCRPR